MALSNSYDFTITRDELIKDALLELGAVDIEESPTAAEITFAGRKLNVLLRSLQSEHIYIHTLDQQSFNTIAYQAAYTPALGTNKILHAYLVIGDTSIEIPVRPVERLYEYPTQSVVGMPEELFVDSRTGGITLYPVPDTICTIKYVRECAIQDVDNAANNLDFPMQGVLLLVKGLASVLAPSYRVSAQDRMLLRDEFREAKREYLARNTKVTGQEIIIPPMVV